MALGLPTQAGLCHHGCEGLPWRAPGGVADRTSVIEGDWREESGPEDRHQVPQEEPLASVHTQG